MSSTAVSAWRFVRFGLLVTGKGEEDFLPDLFRPLTEGGSCHFSVIGRIPHLIPITAERRKARMVGRGQVIPREDEKVGLLAKAFLEKTKNSYVLLIDDLEQDRRAILKAVYHRYRLLLDTMLGPRRLEGRASVHFLTNMLEAYYFADARAINETLGLSLADHDWDVEEIPHPKNELKRLFRGFNEKRHGKEIVGRLDLRHVLSRPEHCASLRTLVAWCMRAMGRPFGDDFRLADGCYHRITGPQVSRLP